VNAAHDHSDHRAHAAHSAKPVHDMNDHGHAAQAHAGHAGHSVAMFRSKFWISLALTIPILVWGHMLPRLLGYAPPELPGSAWVVRVLGTAVFVYGGWPFVQGAVRELRDRIPGMMTLIALAITVAFVYSAAVALGFPGTPLWEELATLVTVMLLGHWLEMRSIHQAQGALGEMAALLPDMATRLAGDAVEEVLVAALRDGDLVVIRSGARVPADGIDAVGIRISRTTDKVSPSIAGSRGAADLRSHLQAPRGGNFKVRHYRARAALASIAPSSEAMELRGSPRGSFEPDAPGVQALAVIPL
jgi:Cu2+-exporting ATPase